MSQIENIILNGSVKLGLDLTSKQYGKFKCYYELLEEKNKVMNLTAITGENEVAQFHFLDSLALLTLEDFKGKRVIDIGSGAGFPGLPMKIAEPDIGLTLLDAQQKRVAFLIELCDRLGFGDVTCLHARAEEMALSQGFRDSFDFALSRAVAALNVLCELCMPFVKAGGMFIAMKSVDSDSEIEEAGHAVKALGGEIKAVRDYKIPDAGVVHRAVIIKKK